MTTHVAKNAMTMLLLSDAEAARVQRRRGAAVLEGLLAALRWLVALPRRSAVLHELGQLSDRELADIGLTRADLPRVFDPDFRGRASAA